MAEINIVPMGTPGPSVSSYISNCYRVVKDEPGIKHQLTPMSTIIEGELEQVLNVVKKMHQVPFNDGVQRVVTSITIDDRRDKQDSMEKMVDAVLH
ncbi:MTH1187 family thiamine-binding protein [Desulfotomaculum copahuensis]|uniref:MTH1187 family thiamine-binding protein n=1 Tax=Desulfotomaculum copahuensis TaxID=1838280 RepID=UPI0031F3D388